ncbi:folate-binding protein [Propionivibrio sp.]|uniref:CAF17-like 4Fe-4S cluster assembly/insertion protein YgfZ n=1 Tax=Propionivibrio sp. TaxID=2212460 RepID=UPI0026198723|nr:folate-binding protein [Propionivibrio sp.]
MNSNWQDFLGASGAHLNHAMVSDFGDIDAELATARDATIIAPLPHLGLLECTGDDAKSFLHNQVTSDINHLESASAQYSSWCTAKGRVLASFLLYRTDSGYLALLSADLLAVIQKRLQMFVMRSKVKITDLSSGHEAIGLSGPQAEAALHSAGLPVPAKALETAAFTGGRVIRLDDSRYILIVISAAAAELWTKLAANARPAGTPVWHWLDIRAGIPLITEATKEAFIPQMTNFDKIGGVSFHKGCYPGQEVVARTQYLGKVKRHLYRIHTTNVIAGGDAIFAPVNPEHPCGMVANAAPAPGGGYDALAVIQETFVATNDLQLGVPGGQRMVRVTLI